jgi:hypothetical protein
MLPNGREGRTWSTETAGWLNNGIRIAECVRIKIRPHCRRNFGGFGRNCTADIRQTASTAKAELRKSDRQSVEVVKTSAQQVLERLRLNRERSARSFSGARLQLPRPADGKRSCARKDEGLCFFRCASVAVSGMVSAILIIERVLNDNYRE